MSTLTLYDVEGLFKATDSLDADAYGSFMADDATVTFANNDPVVGRPAIVEFVGALFGSFAALEHELLDVWTVDGRVIVRMQITFTVPDGRTIKLPAAAISEVVDGLIVDHQVYINDGPLTS